MFGTVVTHLFGGSAGREGTAVQMGGSVAELVGKICKVDSTDRKILLLFCIRSEFGSVFGTPLTGTVFANEGDWNVNYLDFVQTRSRFFYAFFSES